MSFEIKLGVPSLFVKYGERQAKLYMVVTGHYTKKGEYILITRKDLDRMMGHLETVSEMFGARNIPEALEQGMIPAKYMEKIINSLSLGLCSVLINKAEGKSPEAKLNGFLAAAKAVWEEMNNR